MLLFIVVNTFNLILLAGTAYLVGWCGWSPWWFLFTAVLLSGVKWEHRSKSRHSRID